MVNGIVRPPRAKYNEVQLGTILFKLGTKIFHYKDRFYVREDEKVVHEGKII